MRPQDAPNARAATLLLGLSIFFTGASGLVGEYILSTLSSYLLGNSIEQFSITIALMLGMMGVGGWVQKYIGDSCLLEKFILIETLLALLVGFAPLAIYAAFGVLESHFLIVQYLFILAIGFLIGFEIPFIIRINQAYASTLKANLSTVISADYFGSLVGALVWVYWMLPNFSIVENGFILAGVNFLVAVITVVYFHRHRLLQKKAAAFFAVLVTTVSLSAGASYAPEWHDRLQQHLYSAKVVFSETTHYQHLVITHNAKRDEYRFYINGNLQFSSLDEYRYHEQLVHPVMHLAKSRRSVLVLGGGDGMAVRELAKYRDIESITLVDLDPKLVALAGTSPVFRKLNGDAFAHAAVHLPGSGDAVRSAGKRTWTPPSCDPHGLITQQTDAPVMLDVVHIDADRFLDRLSGRTYDVVIIDFPDPSSIDLNKLYTKEFYLKLRHLMTEHAFLVVQSASPFQTGAAYRCIGSTLRAAGMETLPYHDNIPTFGEWGWHIAWKGGSIPQERVMERIGALREFAVPTRHLTPRYFEASTVFPRDFRPGGSACVNTLMEPGLFMLYNREASYYE